MPIEKNTLQGKVCLVTGATAGIGLETARVLAQRDATLIVVGRNRARGAEVVEALQRETGNTSVEFMAADLSSQAEVRRLAADFLARHSRLDVLVNNAGALFAVRRESADGIEMTLAVNHLGPFLLTHLLLDALKAASPSRIVNVASEAHEDVDGFDFADPQARKVYPRSEAASLFYSLVMPWAHPAFMQYARSKLANLLFTTELSRRLADSGVTANALHPGLVASHFSEGNGSYGWFMRRYMSVRGISAEAGARTSIHLACSPEVAGISGQYFIDGKPAAASAAAQDLAAAEKLWRLSEQMTQA
ncbi:MAG: SDR family oxidoreductase [Betaproteobacteria bacterium]|nr:SDR family oxidoreductase [Betaproteobacteria bacterium]